LNLILNNVVLIGIELQNNIVNGMEEKRDVIIIVEMIILYQTLILEFTVEYQKIKCIMIFKKNMEIHMSL